MPRVKHGPGEGQDIPAILQDHTGLETHIATTIINGFFAPLESRVSILEGLIDGLNLQRGVVYEADVPLRQGATGGTVIVETTLPVVDEGLGRSLVITQAPRGDDDEGGIVLFTGTVLDSRHLRLHWYSTFPAPAAVKVVYLIG